MYYRADDLDDMNCQSADKGFARRLRVAPRLSSVSPLPSRHNVSEQHDLL